ncbi:MAG: ATP-binding protein [Microcoleaceae cyanobacterium]
MTPEQFTELARVLPEPSLFITQTGEILAVNKPVSSLFGLKSKELKGRHLHEFLTDSEENTLKYLQSCSRSRKMILGCLTIQLHNGEIVVCRAVGAVMKPASEDNPAQIFLRLEKKEEANSNFILLNKKIEELQTEIESRRQAEIQLKQILAELQNTQIQLIHQEKLSGLGQMAAGIAHEINNPISFIHGNIIPAQEYTKDLLKLIRLYQQYYPDPVPEIEAEIEEIDLEFLTEDLTKLLQSMSVGTERIRQIVKSMRTFSRLDEAEVKEVDLHEGIESTLMILQHRLKIKQDAPPIEVIRKYGNLPEVECYSGQINQVFMNILSNAIDAIVENHNINNNPAQIIIQTETLDNNWVTIKIIDNGSGIKDEVHSKLFDPFFTTKAVGKGTGLGLSISHEIVTQKHGGKLSCHSEIGKGTEFIIQIPVQLKVLQAA